MNVVFFFVTLVAKMNRKSKIKSGGQKCPPTYSTGNLRAIT
jgi:uncharacterized membrane protein YoaK (UPF0700 family)